MYNKVIYVTPIDDPVEEGIVIPVEPTNDSKKNSTEASE